MGTCCVSGCGEIVVDYDKKLFTLSGKTIREGDYISIDGSTGNIYAEAIPTVEATISGDFSRLMDWADRVRKLEVYANADTPRDAKQARSFGAEGIGLCRTEHMFFEEDRIKAMREMIVAKDVETRTVSYTHLDVYKRQIQAMTQSQSPERRRSIARRRWCSYSCEAPSESRRLKSRAGKKTGCIPIDDRSSVIRCASASSAAMTRAPLPSFCDSE